MLRPLILRTLMTNFALTGIALINSILLSRWLGPDGRGEVAATMLWPTILVYPSSLGLIAAIIYFTARPESRPQAIFANTLWLGLLQGSLVMLIGFAALPYLLRSQTETIISASRIFLPVVLLALLAQYGMSILQGQMRLATYNRLRLILPSGYLLGTIILMLTSRLALLNIIRLHLLLNALVLVATWVVLWRSGIRLRFGVDLALVKQLLKYGVKIHIGTITGLANLSLDQALMAAWLPPNYLGLYVVAVSAAGLAQTFSLAVQMVSTPGITQKETLAERIAVLQGVFRRYWWLSLITTLAIAAMLPLAIPLVFGTNFKDAVWPAEVLLVGAFFLGAKEVLAGGAQALGNPWLGSKAQIVAVVVTITLLYLLLPRLGIMGAAITTAFAYATQLVVVAYGLRKTHGIPLAGLFRFKTADLLSILKVSEWLRSERKQLAADRS